MKREGENLEKLIIQGKALGRRGQGLSPTKYTNHESIPKLYCKNV